MAEKITPDYLVIGAGAMGLAFVDALLTSSLDKTFAIVDRYGLPGGHWTVAYPYVKLHQPSRIYGVNSRTLGEDKLDEVGWNKGLLELAGKSEILAYYDKVLRQDFLPSGRVAYYPKHEYTGGREFKSILTDKVVQVGDKTRIVDATYMRVRVPSMGPPAYEVAKDVQFVCLNDLPGVTRPYGNYTVVGAGKTGIDAVSWLLINDIDAARISWIMPRDSYYLHRENFQPPPSPYAQQSAAAAQALNGAIAQASSMDDLIKRWVEYETFLQLDPKVKPEMFRCATVSKAELEQLRKIKNIVRKGRVVRISKDEVVLENGTYKPDSDTLFVDCTGDGLANRPAVPIFQDDKITLQSVRFCQQVFSAALIAHVEDGYSDIDEKNQMCAPVPHPNVPQDFARVLMQTYLNSVQWYPRPETAGWLKGSRLDMGAMMMPPMPEDPEEAAKALAQAKVGLEMMCAKMQKFLDE